jgi:glucosamine-6-phosphate deaminase
MHIVKSAIPSEKIPVNVFSSVEEASYVVALEMAELIRKKQQQGRYAILGLATGSSPKQVYKELIKLHKNGLSFSNVIAFNLDEYYGLYSESPHNYRHFMHEYLFRHVDILPGNCHIPDGTMPLQLVNQHCLEYEKKIELAGGLDYQLLGIGRNGHIGFNEPYSHSYSITRLVTLDNSTRIDAVADFGGLDKVPRKAITMGIQTILNAKKITLLAWGEHKAKVLKEAVECPATDANPASWLQLHKNVTIVADITASSFLSRYKTPWLTEEVTWDRAMIKKAVIHLSLVLEKPVLKLTNKDYDENGLSDLVAITGSAYDVNIKVFNWLQQTITGWPGGKPGADDMYRPERATPEKKRVIIFSPHPDDDIISMGGTFQRLVDQGHEVHVAYQTSGNIAVADDEALRFIEFVKDFHQQFDISSPTLSAIYEEAMSFLENKHNNEKDIPALRMVKGLIRRSEARNTCLFTGIGRNAIHFLNMPFYETGLIEKKPLGDKDIQIIKDLIEIIRPHQVYAAGDLADPHGTHKVCLDAIMRAIGELKNNAWMKDCWVWLYKGAWAEWDIDQIEMAVPMSPDQVLKKRYGIFKHQSQKDGVVFQGTDNREFWQRAEDRNAATALLYNKLGLPEYAAIEAFVRWKF